MRILVCTVVCAIIVGASPGTAGAQTVTGGVKVGVTSTTLSVTGAEGFTPKARTGVEGGAWLRIGREVFGIQPEVIFTTRKFASPSPIGEIRIAARTVEVPVLLSVRIHADRRVHPWFFAGPYVAFISKTTQTVNGVSTDLDAALKDTDAGVTAGLGLEVNLARGALVLETRASLGARNLSQQAGTSYTSRAVMASVGYRFR